MNKTAIQELEEKLKDNLKWIVLNADYELMDKLFIQGLEKEKEQIIDAYLTGADYTCNEEINLANEYYNKNFKK
jgi:hypothetical protein